jgi:hypothetical protein
MINKINIFCKCTKTKININNKNSTIHKNKITINYFYPKSTKTIKIKDIIPRITKMINTDKYTKENNCLYTFLLFTK